MYSRYLLCTLVLILSSCAGAQRSAPATEDSAGDEYQGAAIQDGAVSEEVVENQEPYGPSVPIEGAPPEAPAPAIQEPKLCLILGPGMAKAVAEAAVLEAIRKSELPVHCVVGTEMGAVVGALYSSANGSTNSLYWQLFKFNKDNYFNFPLLSLREPKSTGRQLHSFLENIFKDKQIEQLPIRFATAAYDADRDTLVPFEKGNVADALSATLALPGIFDPWKINGDSLVSGAVSSPLPLDIARRLGGNFLVVIDVLDDMNGAPKDNARFQKAFASARNLMRLQKKEASFVVEIKAGHFAFDDFSRQGEILSAGAKAAEKSVPEMKAAWEKWVAGQR